jgi:hypothetical protein
MAHRAVRLAGAAIGVIAASLAVYAPAAFAKGPPPKGSVSASSSCLVTGTASWKNQPVDAINWTLYENGMPVATADTSLMGVLPSPQSTDSAVANPPNGWQLMTSPNTNAFSVTVQLKSGANQLGSATSRTMQRQLRVMVKAKGAAYGAAGSPFNPQRNHHCSQVADY